MKVQITYDDTLYQLVPKEPTLEMIDAYVNLNGRFQSARSDWAAMLSAAPTPPAQPAERMPLTDEQIAEIASTPAAVVGSYVHTFARAIEAAHGIKGES